MNEMLIALLILLGIVVILIEIFFVPGTTVVGFIGFALVCVGVAVSFWMLGPTAGWITLSLSAVSTGGLGWFAVKRRAWKAFEVKSNIDSKAFDDTYGIAEGATGETITPCMPIGKARILNQVVEVYAHNAFIDAQTPIRVFKIQDAKLIVKPIN